MKVFDFGRSSRVRFAKCDEEPLTVPVAPFVIWEAIWARRMWKCRGRRRDSLDSICKIA